MSIVNYNTVHYHTIGPGDKGELGDRIAGL